MAKITPSILFAAKYCKTILTPHQKPRFRAVAEVSLEKKGAYRIGQDDVLLNADGSPADITVPDLAAAIADDVEKKAHLFQRFTVAN